MAWYDDLDGVSGAEPLSDARLEAWPDRAMDARLHRLRFCPATLPELYQVARHLPLTVIEETGIEQAGTDQMGRPCVMVDFRPETLRRPAFDAGGTLQRSYRPAATRLLPYITTPEGRVMRLLDRAGPPDIPRPPELQLQLAQMLRAQGFGISQLSAAAAILIAEGLLAPQDHGNGAREWLPAADAPPPRMDGRPDPLYFLALRLLAVLEFSRLHRRETGRDGAAGPGPFSGQLQSLLSRDEALRNQTFLIQDDVLDFSAFLSPS
ncbi:hypothetical protein [Gemmobacter serpentinus]|uniref:hypothetical protein n=1 Tax=Gemmobacter serpentinus TaxID=2652247 RepID=UPI00124CB7A6|nr:hypothetical protein [Gemmobacter serpentinus]